MDIIKNPVILALVAGVATYLYMTWSKKEDKKKRKNKKTKNNDSEYVGLVIPAVVAIIIWFIAYGYFEYSKTSVTQNAGLISQPSGNPLTASVRRSPSQMQLPTIPGYKLVKDSKSSEDQIKSFNLIGKGVKIPSKLPDVFIETF